MIATLLLILTCETFTELLWDLVKMTKEFWFGSWDSFLHFLGALGIILLVALPGILYGILANRAEKKRGDGGPFWFGGWW